MERAEPGGWLTPQFARVRGRVQPQSPAIYRTLVEAAAKGLRAPDGVMRTVASRNQRAAPPH